MIHPTVTWLLYFKKINQWLHIFRQKMAVMVSYDVTSCTEEPLWQVVVPEIFVRCQCQQVTKPVHVPHQEARIY